MRFYPDARQRAGITVRMKPAVAAILTCLPLAAQAADPPPAEIIKKMQAVYKSVTTYQVTIKSSQSGKAPQNGQAYSVSQTQVVKTKKPNLFSIQVNQVGTGAAAAATRTELLVSDGKTIYRYVPARKIYLKGPAQPGLPPVGGEQLVAVKFVPGSIKLLPAINVGGRPAYEVQALPDVPKTSTGATPKPINMAIDKSNYYLLRLSVSGGASGLDLSDQIVNGPIASSAFTFNPPAGVKLFTPPPPSMQPGMPGGAPGGVPGGPPRKP